MNKAIERKIIKIYNEIYKKVFNQSAITTLMHGSTAITSARIANLQSSKQFDEFAKKFADELAKKGLANERGIWRQFFKAAKSAHLVALSLSYRQFEYEQMSKAVQHNFMMIKSIPQKILEILSHKYTSTLIEEVVKGKLPRGSFARQLSIHAGKQAKVIARTETAKLRTAITENRATSLGSVAYIWRASNDVRTRPSHKAMNDVVVFWRQGTLKPLLDGMYGNAGEFPNCRCTTFPIFDESDLTKTNYKVYDYNTHEIITMSKKDLLESIRHNELS